MNFAVIELFVITLVTDRERDRGRGGVRVGRREKERVALFVRAYCSISLKR